MNDIRVVVLTLYHMQEVSAGFENEFYLLKNVQRCEPVLFSHGCYVCVY